MAERVIGMLIVPRLTQLDMRRHSIPASPKVAAPELVSALRARLAPLNEPRRQVAERVGRKLGI
jgi:hypothetical protein